MTDTDPRLEAVVAALAKRRGREGVATAYDRHDAKDWIAVVDAVLRFAAAQPPTDAEIEAGLPIIRELGIPLDGSDILRVKRILIAAAKIRSGA